MVCHAVPSDFLPAGARLAVVAVRVNRDAAARRELAPDLDVLRLHELDEILHDDVHAVLVEIAVVAEAEQIQLERFALNHADVRYIRDGDGGEIRLAGNRAQTGKLRTIELDKIIVVRMLVYKGLQHFRCIVIFVFGMLISEQGMKD